MCHAVEHTCWEIKCGKVLLCLTITDGEGEPFREHWPQSRLRTHKDTSKRGYETGLISEDVERDKTFSANSSNRISVWFVKASAFVQMESESLGIHTCELNRKNSRIGCSYGANKELLFVQWYKVTKERSLKVEKIDRKLCWARFWRH